MEIKANLVDIFEEKIYPAKILIEGNRISSIKKISEAENYALPGLVDAHIHIESSLLSPSRFAEVVVPHGTVATVSDPHEIANVLGIEGIKYMIEDSRNVPLKIFYTAPSCVPATIYETNGAKIGPKEIREIFNLERIVALGEVMDFIAVIKEEEEMLEKIRIAKELGKRIDGHAPLLKGDMLKKYVSFGIETDHESVSYEEAIEKALLGMKVMIREGSTAKNMKELIKLAKEGYDCFLVGDDVIVSDLIKGHIDYLLSLAVSFGLDEIKAIQCVSKNPVSHYKIPVGLLREGDPADIVITEDLKKFKVKEVYIEGSLVAKNGIALFKPKPKETINTMKVNKLRAEDLKIKIKANLIEANVIGVIENQIVTEHLREILKVEDNEIKSEQKKDVLKITVIERYGKGNKSIGLIKGFGIKDCAIASSVAHDSHNIISVGTDDDLIAKAVNLIIEKGGGLSFASYDRSEILELSVAGLMSIDDPLRVAEKLEKLHSLLKRHDCALENPYITLSFMALLVIPKLKISDKGIFNVEKQEFIPLVSKILN